MVFGFGSLFGGVKQAVLILEKLERLNTNIQKLTDKIETLETRVTKLEHANELAAVRSEANFENVKVSTTAVVERAITHHYKTLIERIIHIESRLGNLDQPKRSSQTSRLRPPDEPEGT